MALVAQSFHWVRNPDNTLDGAYPAGDKPPTGTALQWSGARDGLYAAGILSMVTGTPFSHDIRQYLSGTEAATATLTVEGLSGDDPNTSGFTISADNLLYDAVAAHTGWQRLVATGASGVAVTTEINWVCTLAEEEPAAASGYDAYYVGAWRATADTVAGWDWSYPSSESPAAMSGVFQFSGYDYPAGFEGHAIYKVDADWEDLEPTEGNYNFSVITNALSNASYDYVQLDVRGTTKVNPLGRTTAAQSWLAAKGIPTVTESNGMVLYDISNATFIVEFKQLISAMAATTVGGYTIPAHPKLMSQIVHGVSNTQLEEWGGTLATQINNDSAKLSRVAGLLEYWASNWGAYSYKLGFVETGRPTEVTGPARDAGLGGRGGILEQWLAWEWTPRYSDASTGNTLEAYKNSAGTVQTGNPYPCYLTIVESDPRISEGRHWGDQNEEYRFDKMSINGSGMGPPLRYQQNYRMSMLRGLQRRVNICAVERPNNNLNLYGGIGGFVNPHILNWVGMQMGHNAATADEAFCCLCKTYTRSYNTLDPGTDNLELHNIERWLYQREPYGAATTAVLKRGHGVNSDDADYEADGTDANGYPTYPWAPTTVNTNVNFPNTLWHIYLGRTGTNIGFKLDDTFLTGVASVAVKVVYMDTGTATWDLEYKVTGGGTASQQQTCGNTGTVKTRTFFIPTFNAVTSAESDLWIKNGGSTPFMFVRVIKL